MFRVSCTLLSSGYQTDKELSGHYAPVGLTPAMIQKFTSVKMVLHNSVHDVISCANFFHSIDSTFHNFNDDITYDSLRFVITHQ